MKKHFVKNGKVKLIYEDERKNNPKSYMYDFVVVGDSPEKPNTAEKEKAVLCYDESSDRDDGLYWEIVQKER